MARAPLAKGDDGASIPPCCCRAHAGANTCPDCMVHVPRTFHAACGLWHRGTCPSTPAVAAILSAPTPEPIDYTLPACER